ncbi:hypothetical protein A5766_02520 [Gordonia sp. 852002-51296_SCH5728562-b]|nr:hypothetical protein A5766_02520 [Gordonia sp. 852002-51296_SCH5728562-b]
MRDSVPGAVADAVTVDVMTTDGVVGVADAFWCVPHPVAVSANAIAAEPSTHAFASRVRCRLVSGRSMHMTVPLDDWTRWVLDPTVT